MSFAKPLTNGDMKGWLHKWTNYIKGYQKRWFVLSNGVLSYYRTQSEMAHTCRGTINLRGAFIHNEDAVSFIVSNNVGTQAFHLKATNAIDKQRWVTALQIAKENMALDKESEDDDEYMVDPRQDSLTSFKSLVNVLEGMKTYNELVVIHGIALTKALTELENAKNAQEALDKVNVVHEKSTLFRITSNSMINKCKEYLTAAQKSSRKWQKMMEYERDQRQRLQEMLEQLAKQHDVLEQAAKAGRFLNNEHDIIVKRKIEIPSMSRSLDTETEDSFYDAYGEDDDDQKDSLVVNDEGKDIFFEESSKSKAFQKVPSVTSSELNRPSGAIIQNKVVKQRRDRIPEKPNYSATLWTILKNNIGKDLSKIAMPVNFSEPLSMLQRLVEDFEYSDILDFAADMDDPDKQLAYVATFTITSYASTAHRTTKPFNPLLGETYECDRRKDRGWRAISEQVSHHPPIAAQHCEGRNWICWQEISVASKFRNNYLQFIPLGTCHLIFKKSGHHISWKKAKTTVNNIIFGKIWLDQSGDTDIINHSTGSKCRLNYVEYSLFSRESRRKVKGCVLNKNGEALWVVNGNWDTSVEIAKVTSTVGAKDNPVYRTQEWALAWEANALPEDAEKYYNFSVFASQLNEMEDGVAPTDSRLRPDQRLMEEGKWDEANELKVTLEKKQRTIRELQQQEYMEHLERQSTEIKENPRTSVDSTRNSKDFKNMHPPHVPLWFKRELEPVTDEVTHLYKGGYWEAKKAGDWSMCPNLF